MSHRMRHRMRRGHPRRPPVFFGVIFLLLGTLFLLDNLNIIEARDFIRTYWPALLVLWGSARMAFGRGGERVMGAFAIGLGGLLLANRVLGWDVRVWRLIWPVVFIAIGVHILFRSYRRPGYSSGIDAGYGAGPVIEDQSATAGEAQSPKPDEPVESSAFIKEFAVAGHVKRTNVSQAFRGGEITAVMGGVELDLRQCRMAGNQAQIDVSVVMGGIELRVPRDWTVESRVSMMMGGLEDETEPPVDGSTKRLVIDGSAFMGGVQIKN